MPIDFQCPYCGCHTQVADQFAGATGNCRKCGQPVTIPAAGGDPLMPMQAVPVKKKKATPIWALIALAVGGAVVIGAVIIGMVYLGARKPSGTTIVQSGDLIGCNQNLLNISMALSSYHEEYGSFPAAVTKDSSGRAMHSWRVFLLPYLGDDAKKLHKQYDFSQPWNSAKNKKLIAKMPDVFRCPASDSTPRGQTHYLAIVGKGCVWGVNRYTKLSDVKDRPQLTLLVAESLKSVPWTQPADMEFKRINNVIGSRKDGVGSDHREEGAHVVFLDWSVHFLPAEYESGIVIKEAAQIADGDKEMLERQAQLFLQRQRDYQDEEGEEFDGMEDDEF